MYDLEQAFREIIEQEPAGLRELTPEEYRAAWCALKQSGVIAGPEEPPE